MKTTTMIAKLSVMAAAAMLVMGVNAHATLMFFASYDTSTTADIAAPGTAIPAVSSGVSITNPGFNSPGAVYIPSVATLEYSTAGNINATQGTVEFWYKPDNSNFTANYRLFELWDSAATRIIDVYTSAPTTSSMAFSAYSDPSYFSGGSTVNVYDKGPFTADQWVFGAVTWNDSGLNSGLRVYLDAEAAATVGAFNTTPASLYSSFYVGTGEGANAIGTIDNLTIYDTQLTPGQILADYNAGLVPEPSTLLLLGMGGFVLWLRRRNRQS